MGLSIYKVSDYNHIAEQAQFDSICELLQQTYGDSQDECVLVGNYNIEGVELDALLITPGGIRILEFKNWGGNILARENGSWKSDEMIIEGGSGKKTPFEQIRLNKSRVTKGLVNLLGINPQIISAAIIFWQDSVIDDSQISGTVKLWLTICDNSNLQHILKGLNTQLIPNEFINTIPTRLRIQEFSLGNKHNKTIVTNEIYESESSINYFEELEHSVDLKPDYNRIYLAYNQVFQKFLNQKTSQTRINFGGPFAKTDYLLKEYKASRKLCKTINDTRVRLRKLSELSVSDKEKYYLFDLENICRFIACVCNCSIPNKLESLFPTEALPYFKPTLIEECVRAIVEKWDDEYVYVQTEINLIDGITKVCYTHGNIYDYDWTYLSSMFYKGAQLNLVRPRIDDGIIYPELIIFEPDYLVNITSVARCFTNYADSPFVDLIKKLEPSITTEPIILGNLAGQLLDESIHQLPNTRSYSDSVKDFFKSNALGLLSAGVSPQFHTDAQIQKLNINEAINVTLPRTVQRFNSKDGLVEPSFFSEMLGLQGRMDYLQMDFKVLLEQKSGKGSFPYDDFIKPKQTVEHYVQLLLYMALIRYNYRETYERNNRELHAFLLYSKYKDSLLGLGFSGGLLYDAIRVRNGIAWTEILYTQPNGYRILDGLTADQLNLKKVNNSLWTNYQLPQISKILLPIQNASELEKAYYFRFLTFIANEHIMSKIGNKTKENSGFASTWLDSLTDKLASGNIYDKLTLESPTTDTPGQIDEVILSFSETEDNDMSNFRVGDIVILYPYEVDEEPDACKTMVFRCTIKDIQNDRIQLVLRSTQSDNRVFIRQQGKMWAIEHDFMESSYSSLYKGMQSFLNASKRRRDLLLLQREPEIDTGLSLIGNYKNSDSDFNDLVLKCKSAKDLFLIDGPPGTGKTAHGLLNIVKEEYLDPDSTILLLSYTNRAVDEICSKLEKEGIDYVRIGSTLSCAEEYRDHLLGSIVQEVSSVNELKEKIQTARIIVGTTTSLNSNISIFQLKQFSLAVIDEASQILEPHLIGLLSTEIKGVPAIRKIVLIGDYKQLPAVVQQSPEVSKVQDTRLNEIYLTDCRLSLFERFLKKYSDNKNLTYRLRKQGRMHHEIALFPNYTFYNNRLIEADRTRQTEKLPLSGTGNNGVVDILKTRRIVFLASEKPNKSVSDKVNQVEAEMIAAIVIKIYEIERNNGFDVNGTVGVIVPYRNQVAAVRKAIDNYGIQTLHDITIDTVERFQGSQRKYIIYGFTVQKYYQLNFLTNNVFEDEIDGCIVDRKLNVAMTRAEEQLIMIGNPALLANNFTFYKLMEFVRSRHGFFQIQKDIFISGKFVVPQYDPNELDLSGATFSVSKAYNDAYTKNILVPIQKHPDTEWPSKIFGYDMGTNLNAIGYGRINFTERIKILNEKHLSPEQQVQLYCYYIMRQHYCSSQAIYSSYKDWINTQIESVQGRVHFIDIGCGPATCGVAFAELFKDKAPNMVYTGIDVSREMKRMGAKILDDVFSKRLYYQMKESFDELEGNFWEGCSELPSLVLINLSYFFSNVSSHFTEELAQQICVVMKKYPLNKYIFFIQHSELDKQLNSYDVFRRLLSDYVLTFKSDESSFTYLLNYKERTLDFCYDIFVNR